LGNIFKPKTKTPFLAQKARNLNPQGVVTPKNQLYPQKMGGNKKPEKRFKNHL